MDTNNNNDNNNDNNNNNKKTRIKNKNKKYIDERNDVLARLYQIIGITDTNKQFSSNHIEESEEIINRIYELEPDIKKYYSVSTWPSYKKDVIVTRRPLSIVKSLLKDMNINYETLNVRKTYKDEIKHSTIYKLT